MTTSSPAPSHVDGASDRSRSRLRHAGRALVALPIGLAVHLVLVWALVAAEQQQHPPSCFGIGWGCEPDPGASAFLWGALVAGPLTVGVAIVLLLTGLLRSETWRRRTAYTIGGTYLAAAFIAPLLQFATAS